MTAADKNLIHQCGTILLNDPDGDDIYFIAEALRLIAEKTNIVAKCDAIGTEYLSLVDDAKHYGTL